MDVPLNRHRASRVWVSQDDWVTHRDQICHLYGPRRLTLASVQRIMEEEHGFYATSKMYKIRFKQWGLRKNAAHRTHRGQPKTDLTAGDAALADARPGPADRGTTSHDPKPINRLAFRSRVPYASETSLTRPYRPTAAPTISPSPVFRPQGIRDDTDARLLWFYTCKTYTSWEVQGPYAPAVDNILRVKLVQYALQSRFLMQFILGLAGLQLETAGTGARFMPSARLAAYRTMAFSGYRAAIDRMDPAEAPALLSSSFLMLPLTISSESLDIVNWFAVWRGMVTIIEAVPPAALHASGLGLLFYRPRLLDTSEALAAVPPYLLSLCGISPTDPPETPPEGEEEESETWMTTYRDVARHLGHLYHELRQEGGLGQDGILSPMLELRIITWATFMPPEFIRLARRDLDVPLIVIAHYCAFLKLVRSFWWLPRNMADRQLDHLLRRLGGTGPGSAEFLHVLRRVRTVTETADIARILLGEDSSRQSTESPAAHSQDGGSSPKGSNSDTSRSGRQERWVLTADGPLLNQLRVADPAAVSELSGENTVLGRDQ